MVKSFYWRHNSNGKKLTINSYLFRLCGFHKKNHEADAAQLPKHSQAGSGAEAAAGAGRGAVQAT